MAIEITSTHIISQEHRIEVDVTFSEEPGPPYHSARVTVFVENRDCPLSELKVEAIQKAKAFLSQIVSSLPD
jgi:hypothetical protein